MVLLLRLQKAITEERRSEPSDRSRRSIFPFVFTVFTQYRDQMQWDELLISKGDFGRNFRLILEQEHTHTRASAHIVQYIEYIVHVCVRVCMYVCVCVRVCVHERA